MKQLQGLMQKEMSRKEFLATIGLAIVSIMGFSTLINTLMGKNHNQQTNIGYGSNPYGGTKRS
jgi:hypothetical protein